MGENGCICKNETDEVRFNKIGEYIDSYGEDQKPLIQILHYVQGMYGYIPIEAQKFIAQKTGNHLSEISGIISFYSYFTSKPRGEYTIKVCLGTACYVRGGKKILKRLKELLKVEPGSTSEDGKFTLEVMRCAGSCGLAPVLSINDKVYKQVNPEKLKAIIEQYY